MADECNIVPLNGKNYRSWKFRVELYLKAKNLHKVVTKKTDKKSLTEEKRKLFKQCDNRAKALISQLVDDQQIDILRGKRTANEFWIALEEKYDKIDLATQLNLTTKLSLIRLEEGESLEEYLSKVDEVFREMNELGCPMDEEGAICHVLSHLPESYNDIKTVILESIPQNELTLDIVKEKLVLHDQSLKDLKDSEKDEAENENPVSSNQVTSNKVSTDDFVVRCNFCCKLGHVYQNCRSRLGLNQRGGRSNHQPRGYQPYDRTASHRQHRSGYSGEARRSFGTNRHLNADRYYQQQESKDGNLESGEIFVIDTGNVKPERSDD